MAKFPTKLGPCVDLAYTLREDRLAFQKEFEKKLEALKAKEDAINQHIIDTFTVDQISAARGEICSASVSLSVLPTNVEWPTFFAYVKKTGAFDLLEKRIAKVAFRERIEGGVKVPGVEVFKKKTLHLTKINGSK